MARKPALAEKDDGTQYSRIARRAVRILKHVTSGKPFQISDLVSEIHESAYPEFVVITPKGPVQIAQARLRDYITFLIDLKCFEKVEKQYRLILKKPTTDAHWTQALSDLAREQLAELLDVTPAELPTHLDQIRVKMHSANRVPTLSALVSEVGVEGSRRQEVFRWALYLYCDGEAAPLEVRRYPHLSVRD